LTTECVFNHSENGPGLQNNFLLLDLDRKNPKLCFLIDSNILNTRLMTVIMSSL